MELLDELPECVELNSEPWAVFIVEVAQLDK
jgi:hypothetical protein